LARLLVILARRMETRRPLVAGGFGSELNRPNAATPQLRERGRGRRDPSCACFSPTPGRFLHNRRERRAPPCGLRQGWDLLKTKMGRGLGSRALAMSAAMRRARSAGHQLRGRIGGPAPSQNRRVGAQKRRGFPKNPRRVPRVVSTLLLGAAPGVRPEPAQMCARNR
jgi:hypothetical protein